MRWLLKRWWLWTWTGFILVAIAAGWLLIPFDAPRITQANCDKIQLDWSLDQVEELLGKGYSWGGSKEARILMISWTDDDGNCITVMFDQLDVTHKNFDHTDLPLLERMKHRIERRIRALWP